MILRNLLRRKLRTLFALCGVALGIAAMVSLTAITQGIVHQFQQLVRDYRGDVIVMKANVPDPIFSRLDLKLAGELAAIPEVKEVCPMLLTGTRVPGQPFFFVFGLPAESALLQRHRLTAGRYFKSRAGELILGSGAAASLGKAAGDTLELQGETFAIVGIYEIGIRIVDHACMLDLPDASRVAHADYANLMMLDLHDARAQVAGVVRDIPRRFPDLQAGPSASFLDNFDQVNLVQDMAFVVSIVAVAIAAVGILNTMMMSVYERTREIGLLRAIGWPRRRIMGMILGEGVLIALGGGVLGIGLGAVGTEALLRWIRIGSLDSHYPPSLFANAMLFSLVVGIFGALLPAWKASRFSPVEAMRYE